MFLKQADLQTLRAYETRQDVEKYTEVLKEILSLFGEGMHESLTRTMGEYLEVTCGRLSNSNKSEWEKDIASRMIGSNNPAESPFATVRAFLHMYPRYMPLPEILPTLLTLHPVPQQTLIINSHIVTALN
jgi:hypothetical protein